MIKIDKLTKTYDGADEPAVRELSLESPKGSFLTLLGPSGCGKSTTLRSIAGLERPDSGTISIDEKVVYSGSDRVSLSPAQRRVGMVFQSYAIWPHMTVYKNVEYPLKRQRVSKGERRERVHEALDLVGLTEMEDRPAPNLSGGQQQRVALARAIVGHPTVLLLDEPLSNLDARLRRELGSYLRELQQRLELTVVYVTHDQDEAMSMSDIVALMSDGQILEWGRPEEIYRQPRTSFGARFLGAANFLQGSASRAGHDEWEADTSVGRVIFEDRRRECVAGPVTLMVRPENVVLRRRADDARRPDTPNLLSGTVRSSDFLGMYWESKIELTDGTMFIVRTQGERWWASGDVVSLSFETQTCFHVGMDDIADEVSEAAPEGRGDQVSPNLEPFTAPPAAGEVATTQGDIKT